MKAIVLFALIFGGLQFGEELEAESYKLEKQPYCMVAEHITRPARKWQIFKTELKTKKKQKFLELTIHNPESKQPKSIDAQFVLSIDSVDASNTSKYSLDSAVYYHSDTTVSFKRIFIIRDVVSNNKIKKFPIQTPCFTRKVENVIRFDEPLIINRRN